jgi:hypothetical protein
MKKSVIIGASVATLAAAGIAIGLVVGLRNTSSGDKDASPSSSDSDYVGTTRLTMQEPTGRRRRALQSGNESAVGSFGQMQVLDYAGSQTLWWSSNDGLEPPYVSRETPTVLKGLITYASVSESGGEGSPSCLGDDPASNWNFCPPQGSCCVNSIIYENNGCCKNGATPGLDTVDLCTFDSRDNQGCSSDCSLSATNDNVREGCQNWYGANTYGPRPSHFIDFAQNSSSVNADLGSTVLPFLRNTFLPFATAGGKFRSVGIMWSGALADPSESNWKFSSDAFGNDSLVQEFAWHISNTYYFPEDEQIGISEGSGIQFALEYDLTDMVYVWNFSSPEALSGLDAAVDVDTATNCVKNVDTQLYACLNLDMLDDVFVPRAQVVEGLSLYNDTLAAQNIID